VIQSNGDVQAVSTAFEQAGKPLKRFAPVSFHFPTGLKPRC